MSGPGINGKHFTGNSEGGDPNSPLATLTIDLDPAVPRERVAQSPAMLRKYGGVLLSELV